MAGGGNPRRRSRGRLVAWAGSIAVALAIHPAVEAAGIPPLPIPQDPTEARSARPFFGEAAVPNPVPAPAVPQHPFMAPNGRSNIHDDAYMTDTYRIPGPIGRSLRVRSTFLVADCASLTFDRAGRVVTICVGLQGPTLVMIDPRTLATMAAFPLPPRIPTGGGSPFSDFAGGGYFYLDHRDRAVIPTTTRQIWVVAETSTPLGPGFRLDRTYDLSAVTRIDEGIVSVLPDWTGRLWFVTTDGLVGTVDPKSGAVRTLRLGGEVIANSFAVDETGGVFVVSDHALYGFDAGPEGQPGVTWRQRYDRGRRVKPGQVSQGSGTTPSLMGTDLVAITDNADPRMHVLVYRREAAGGPRLVCSVPVFAPGRGATENSLIVTGRSMVVENNYGYDSPLATENGGSTEPGVTRIDVRRGQGCRTVWTSAERVPNTVSKLSLATGLVYTYAKPIQDDVDGWYLTAIDFRTGKTVFRRLAGTDLGYNSNYAPVSLGPDGAAYVGALGGLIQLRDG